VTTLTIRPGACEVGGGRDCYKGRGGDVKGTGFREMLKAENRRSPRNNGLLGGQTKKGGLI